MSSFRSVLELLQLQERCVFFWACWRFWQQELDLRPGVSGNSPLPRWQFFSWNPKFLSKCVVINGKVDFNWLSLWGVSSFILTCSTSAMDLGAMLTDGFGRGPVYRIHTFSDPKERVLDLSSPVFLICTRACPSLIGSKQTLPLLFLIQETHAWGASLPIIPIPSVLNTFLHAVPDNSTLRDSTQRIHCVLGFDQPYLELHLNRSSSSVTKPWHLFRQYLSLSSPLLWLSRYKLGELSSKISPWLAR